jgi:hypothetical protein
MFPFSPPSLFQDKRTKAFLFDGAPTFCHDKNFTAMLKDGFNVRFPSGREAMQRSEPPYFCPTNGKASAPNIYDEAVKAGPCHFPRPAPKTSAGKIKDLVFQLASITQGKRRHPCWRLRKRIWANQIAFEEDGISCGG